MAWGMWTDKSFKSKYHQLKDPSIVFLTEALENWFLVSKGAAAIPAIGDL